MSNPNLISRLAELSLAALTENRLDAVEPICRLGLMINSEAGVFRHHLGLLALIRDDTVAALPQLRAAVEAYGSDAGDGALAARRDLAVADLMAERYGDARADALDGLAVWPNDAALSRIVAQAAEASNDAEAAIEYYGRALAYCAANAPDRAEIAFSYGNLLYARRRLGEAYAAFRTAIDADRTFAKAWCNLGNTLSDLARPAEALKAYEAALEIDPAYRHAHSNALQTLHYLPGQSAVSLGAAHRAWAARHFPEAPPPPPAAPLGRRISVGLVSEDLRRHPVGYFTAGWIRAARDAGIDVAVYASNRVNDDLTAEIRMHAAAWHDVAGQDDAALAKTIRADAPDVLIDLAGHTGNNRLGAFALRPAAVQATWMGYVGTTGLAQIDGLIADRIHVPRLEEPAYVETIWRMPNGYVCYAPPAYAPAPRNGAWRRTGHITFAAFHNPAKLNPELIATWAKIIAGVEDSRLRIAFRGLDEPIARDGIVSTFAAHGISADRLEISGAVPHAVLLDLYNDCDFALDSFPYAGGLTTLEALWMGIPVITAPGKTFASRHAASHVTFSGFGHEVAANRSDYIHTAVTWAHAPAMRDADRAARRARMRASPACDGATFARDLATLLRAAHAATLKDRSR